MAAVTTDARVHDVHKIKSMQDSGFLVTCPANSAITYCTRHVAVEQGVAVTAMNGLSCDMSAFDFPTQRPACQLARFDAHMRLPCMKVQRVCEALNHTFAIVYIRPKQCLFN